MFDDRCDAYISNARTPPAIESPFVDLINWCGRGTCPNFPARASRRPSKYGSGAIWTGVNTML